MTPIARTAAQLERCSLPEHVASALVQRTRERVRIAFDEAVVDVRFECREAAKRFHRRYVDFVSSAPIARTMDVACDDSATYWHAGERVYRWPGVLKDPYEIAFLTDTLVRHELFAYGGPHFAFHAAAVRIGDVAIAISGVSGSGKTTTTIACARLGMAPYSDEQCAMAGGDVVPFPRAIDVRAGTVAAFACEPDFADRGIRERLVARRGRRWTSARFADLFGVATVPEPAPLVALYFIVGRGDAVGIEPLDLAASLPLYFGAFPLGHRDGVVRVADALAFLRRTPAFALTLGTPDATARALLATHAP